MTNAVEVPRLSGTKIASQNRSDHGGRKRARNHSAAEIAGFFASAAAKKSLAASDFGGLPQNRRKLAATTAASSRSRAILRPQRPRDTKFLEKKEPEGQFSSERLSEGFPPLVMHLCSASKCFVWSLNCAGLNGPKHTWGNLICVDDLERL